MTEREKVKKREMLFICVHRYLDIMAIICHSMEKHFHFFFAVTLFALEKNLLFCSKSGICEQIYSVC